MSKKRWSQIEITILHRFYPDYMTRAIADALGRTERQVYSKAAALGLKKSPEYLASPKSGRTNGSQGGATRFKKGMTPWNKGKPGSTGTHPNSRRTQFKKGEMSGAAQHNYVPIGSTRVTRYGSLERKVTDDPSLYPAKRWRPVAHLVWESNNGTIPPKHIVRFKDGMHTAEEEEITIDKLECISRAENMRRNSMHRYPKEIALAIQLRGALNRRIRNVEKHQSSS